MKIDINLIIWDIRLSRMRHFLNIPVKLKVYGILLFNGEQKCYFILVIFHGGNILLIVLLIYDYEIAQLSGAQSSYTVFFWTPSILQCYKIFQNDSDENKKCYVTSIIIMCHLINFYLDATLQRTEENKRKGKQKNKRLIKNVLTESTAGSKISNCYIIHTH